MLADGDIVNIDITAFIGGVHGDTNATFLVGDVDEETRAAGRAHRGVPATARSRRSPGSPDQRHRPGHRVLRRRFGYGVVRDFTGHGIGTAFHSGLIIPHYDDPRARRP